MKYACTALLLNWRRSENLIKIIKKLKSQTCNIEIFLWNNANDTIQYDVDLQIDSGKNLMCWPRWTLASLANSDCIFTLDDDFIIKDDYVIEDCLNYCEKNDCSLGYIGVILNDHKDYWKSEHIGKPEKNRDISVDILKGRFIFTKKAYLKDIPFLPKRFEDKNRIEDDIIISSFLETKIIPSFLLKRL